MDADAILADAEHIVKTGWVLRSDFEAVEAGMQPDPEDFAAVDAILAECGVRPNELAADEQERYDLALANKLNRILGEG